MQFSLAFPLFKHFCLPKKLKLQITTGKKFKNNKRQKIKIDGQYKKQTTKKLNS